MGSNLSDLEMTARATGATPALRAQEKRDLFVFPVPLDHFVAKLQLPFDLTPDEARKISKVLMAFAGLEIEPRGLSAIEAPTSPEDVTP